MNITTLCVSVTGSHAYLNDRRLSPNTCDALAWLIVVCKHTQALHVQSVAKSYVGVDSEGVAFSCQTGVMVSNKTPD